MVWCIHSGNTESLGAYADTSENFMLMAYNLGTLDYQQLWRLILSMTIQNFRQKWALTSTLIQLPRNPSPCVRILYSSAHVVTKHLVRALRLCVEDDTCTESKT